VAFIESLQKAKSHNCWGTILLSRIGSCSSLGERRLFVNGTRMHIRLFDRQADGSSTGLEFESVHSPLEMFDLLVV